MKIPVPIKFGISGEKRCILRNADESVIYDSGWSDNLITNQGLQNMLEGGTLGNANWGVWWSVGSSSTPPAVTDTTHGAFLKWFNGSTGVSAVKTNSGSNNYIMSHTDSRRWNSGDGSGTVREFGLGSTTTGTDLSIHTAVSPEVEKANDQILDFYYRMTCTPVIADQTGSFTLDNKGTPVTYYYIARPIRLDQTTFSIINGQFRETSTPQIFDGNINPDIGTAGVTNPSGDVQSLTGVGNEYFGLSITVDAGAGTGTRNWRQNISVDNGNFAGGVRSIRCPFQFMSQTGTGIQVQYGDAPGATGNAIPKTANDKIELDFQLTITRT